MVDIGDILFRGRRLDNNEWVFWSARGKLTVTQYGKLISGKTGPTDWAYELLTDPNTESQYVGKMDRNGKRIFGKDIVKHYNWSERPEHYVIQVVEWDAKRFRWSVRDPRTGECWTVGENCIYEVIGNTVDNPELLEL